MCVCVCGYVCVCVSVSYVPTRGVRGSRKSSTYSLEDTFLINVKGIQLVSTDRW